MARKPRFNLIGVPQHVIQRGNNCEPCFFADSDYIYYLNCLQQSAEKFGCLIHAYVLMTNHVHILATPQMDYGISQMMQSIGRKYVRYVNTKYHRTGTLWEGRYKASLVDTEHYLLTCMKYIELNPLRAGMVEEPGEYPWSSYERNARGKENARIFEHPVYTALGKNIDERASVYHATFSHSIGYTTLDEIRKAVNQELVLGKDLFKEKIAAMTQRRVVPGKPGRPRVKDVEGYYFV